MAEEKSSGWLTKVFKAVVKTVTIGVIAAVAWQVFLDPLFFPLFHDTTNLIAQAWIVKDNAMFGWIPQHAGFSQTPGLLTGLLRWLLGPEIAALTPPTGEKLVERMGGDGFDLDSDLISGTSSALPEALPDAADAAGAAVTGTSWLPDFSSWMPDLTPALSMA